MRRLAPLLVRSSAAGPLTEETDGALAIPPATSKTILSQSGIRGFYRGLGPTVLGYIPTWAIYFTVYDAVKLRLGNGGDPSLAASPSESISPVLKSPVDMQVVDGEDAASIDVLGSTCQLGDLCRR